MFVLIGIIIFIYVSYQVYQHFFPTPDIDPTNKYVLISGCDTGFGNGLAIELDKQGFNVLAGVYNPNSKDSLTKILSSRATVFLLDITKQEDIDAAYEMISQKTKVLHGLVNNAGIGAGGLIDWISVDFMRKMMDVNFFGHVAMTKKFLPLLIAKRDSRVVNICSVAGYLTKPGMSAYAASKYALESFSDCLRREMAVWGLRVSIIEPGFMRTAIVEGHDKSLRTLWNGLTDDVKDRWGEEHLNQQITEVVNNIFMKNAEDPAKVVQVLKHAVMNTAPRIRYRPGWQSTYIMFPISRGPAWLADLLMIRPSLKGPLPAGIRKQLPA
jgi:11-cis-retinol dehydrogenase